MECVHLLLFIHHNQKVVEVVIGNGPGCSFTAEDTVVEICIEVESNKFLCFNLLWELDMCALFHLMLSASEVVV